MTPEGTLIAMYEKKFDQWLAYGMSKLNDEQLAQDAVQETFLKVFRNAHNLTPDNLPGYFFTALYSVVVDMGRNIRANSTQFYGDNLEDVLASGLSISNPSQGMYDSGLLLEALSDLGADDQKVINMEYFVGISRQESASQMRISTEAFRKRIVRACSRLKTRYMTRLAAKERERIISR